MEMFRPGRIVETSATRLSCEVEQFLGGGAQGEVYRARLGGRDVALKWYFPNSATDQQRASLERLVRKGPPDRRFLWPMELATASGTPGFGYIMMLREPRYRGLVDLMRRRIDPSLRALVTAGFELADSFLQLHSKGLCYRDISFGNLFLDPDTGAVLICDNDNVTVDGDFSSQILGTPRFMAPEIVRGEALPSTQTDLFSLAVLLFYLFLIHHPLEGRRELSIHSFDLPAMTKLYGDEPLFIFHPADRSNEPVRGYHDNAIASWPIYPTMLRDLFTRAFTDGISDPAHGRVREGEWRSALICLRDSLMYCQMCATENFLDPADGSTPRCWNCEHLIQAPFRLRIGRNVVVLNHDTKLFPHHIDEQRPYNFADPVAAITRHPTVAGVWGLKNLSTENWSFQTAGDALPAEIPPGRTVTLATGTRINFGRAEGEIRQ
jgi:DNA-binding helix-hairpin-helix protein with protein kinase domain